ncbi:Golgi transport complex subunit 5-domain-containing protein [Tirmania nivea]|nr:Golgi transport complex subunit 5-domain-containing protein [Tirmania nivea]
MEAEPPSDSYIDYEAFLSPTFSPHSFANALILHTNTSDDPNLDLSTPLSRVLFDLQEIDSHIHSLTTGNASELLAYAEESRSVSEGLVKGVEEQMKVVGAAYRRLEREVVGRGRAAEEVLGVVERLSGVTRVVRVVGRVVLLGRQLEGLVGEWFSSRGATGGGTGGEGDWKVLLRIGYTVAEMRRTLVADKEKEGGGELAEVNCVKVVVSQLLVPAEQYLKTTATGVVANFALPTTSTTTNIGTSNPTTSSFPPTTSTTTSSSFAAQKFLEAYLSRVSSATQILYLLSPPSTLKPSSDSPLLLQVLNTFLTNQTTTSLAALSRVFSSLTPTQPSPPALDRSFLEIVQKIRGIAALEEVLKSVPLSILDSTSTIPTTNPTLDGVDNEDEAALGEEDDAEQTLLGFVLADLDTPSLPTLFFRNLSSGLETLVRNVLARGGVAARGLRAGKDKLREGLRGVVERGLAGEDGSVRVGGDGRRGGRRKRRAGEREVGIGVVIGGVEKGFGER